MSKLLLSILFVAALMGAGPSVIAAEHMAMDMKMMDTNKDGMISKDEFMKYHEAMWMKMKKKGGMVDMKDMEMMQSGMMKDDGMRQGDKMKGDKQSKDVAPGK